MRLSVLFATLLVLVFPVMAFAHAHLDHASPAAGSTVSTAPKSVEMWFTENLEPKFSGVEVRNDKGERVDTGKTQVDHAHMRAGLKALPPGTYKVNWHVLSVDTHKTLGNFSFTVGR